MSELKYKVLTKDVVGRYAVATKKLEPGEVILSELPFVVGPKIDTYPICLGCYAYVDGTYLCSKCQWPVCGPECEAISRHADAECQIFSKANVKWQVVEDLSQPCPQYDCITPLRMLLAKEKDPTRWDREVAMMMSHTEKRQKQPHWETERINVVEFLRSHCKLADRFSADLIHQVCGILEVNAYEARATSDSRVQALYPQLAILSHSCVPNVMHSIIAGPLPEIDQDFKVTVRAAVSIESGTELLSTYTHVLSPTLLRREYLAENKYFECKCSRCADPTELGTHVGTLKCNKCDNGVIISSNPLDQTAIWKCTHCEFTTKGEAVRKVFLTIQAELDALDELGLTPEGIEQREQLARKYRSVLHPRHSVHTNIRQALTQLYGRVPGYVLDELPDLLLERKVELCQEVLNVLDVVEPGYTRLRGLTLYELHAPLIYLARNQYQSGTINEDTLRIKFNDAAAILEKAVIILSQEDPNSPEGSVGVIAAQSLQQFRDNMDTMIASL